MPVLLKGKPGARCRSTPTTPPRSAWPTATRRRRAAGWVEVMPVEVTDGIRPGVVSIPHGWGHDVARRAAAVAAEHAGVNSNVLADEDLFDPVSGNAVLNGIPVSVTAADLEGRPDRVSRGRYAAEAATARRARGVEHRCARRGAGDGGRSRWLAASRVTSHAARVTGRPSGGEAGVRQLRRSVGRTPGRRGRRR